MKWLLILLSAVTFSLSNPPPIPENIPELKCLAINIYHEARGEPIEGQLAVGRVTLNRVKDGRWANTVCKVVHQKHQFSWTNKRKKPVEPDEQLLGIARASKYYETDALYYHTHKVKPIWRKKLQKVAVVGNHIFYKDEKRKV